MEFAVHFSVDGNRPSARLGHMTTPQLPSHDTMLAAFGRRDSTYDGVFVTAVKTTGIFCRPTCPARRPLPKNIEFFAGARDALVAGYRPCKRCQPMTPTGAAPPWVSQLLSQVDRDPTRRWTDADLRTLDIDPSRARRWFQRNHGMTFHAYQRARRLGLALGTIQQGEPLSRAGYGHGFESDSGFRDAFARVFGAPPGRGRATKLAWASRLTTPLGPMIAVVAEEGVALLEFADRPMLETQLRQVRRRLDCSVAPGGGDHPLMRQLQGELDQYFAGHRHQFSVPLLPAGTPFQEAVWAELAAIPYGETRSYQAIARAIGRPTARRAVGRANGDNRLAILLPCHRVVGQDGTLTGYGGGLWRKRRLLALEQQPRSAPALVATG